MSRKAAIIENDRVANIILLAENDDPTKYGAVWLDQSVGVGWVKTPDGTFTSPLSYSNLPKSISDQHIVDEIDRILAQYEQS